jgi:hypothetical protein
MKVVRQSLDPNPLSTRRNTIHGILKLFNRLPQLQPIKPAGISRKLLGFGGFHIEKFFSFLVQKRLMLMHQYFPLNLAWLALFISVAGKWVCTIS